MEANPRGHLDRRLEDLERAILALGDLVDRSISHSVDALKARDTGLATQVVDGDEVINQKRFDIEEMCTALIATQQPAAKDLRYIVSAMNIITELERMADHAAGIATLVLRLGDEPLLKPLVDIPRMAERTRSMLHRSLEAFLAGDVDAAERVGAEDDEIDSLYHQVYRELLSFMIEDPRTISRATNLLWVAHNLERIADRTTNIAERAIYQETGVMREFGADTGPPEEPEAPGG
ncbi:MAG: phosphate signaling complex protein PhoU [Anaerolineae bacterium]